MQSSHNPLQRSTLALVALLAFVLSSCGGQDPAPTAPPLLVQVTATANPTATRAPIVQVVATQRAAPASPTKSANALPPNTCPFTGLPLNGVNLAERRPLLVKLGNSPPERPQSGLAQADIVFEHLTEGAITRFSAIFYCSVAASIGPIRSARLIDLELVPMFGAIFAHVGGSEPVRQMIADSDISKADLDDYGHAPIFREVPERKRPFNRYTSSQEMQALEVKKNLISGTQVPAFNFSTAVPTGGRAAATVSIPYRKNLSEAVFTYDPATQLYNRSVGTTPQLDGGTNQPVTAANVIVLYAPHETTTIVEDSLGSRSIKITLTGTGKATLVRDGQAYDVTWARNAPNELLQFTAADGNPFRFKPGNIWVEVVPVEMQVPVQQ